MSSDPRVPLLTASETEQVQSLVLRTPSGNAVRHVILRVPDRKGMHARAVLARQPWSFGLQPAAVVATLGLTSAGLEALCLPQSYLRILQRLAPSFREGAVRRSGHVGDAGPSAAPRWMSGFQQHEAHVVASFHGAESDVGKAADGLRQDWERLVSRGGQHVWIIPGRRLGCPPGEIGEWAHFRLRDDVSEVRVDALTDRAAPDLRTHAPGTVLLGRRDDDGFDRFVLSQAPTKVRTFFRDSTFGILRPLLQDVTAFEAQVQDVAQTLAARYGANAFRDEQAKRDFARAKLCGRWPDGRPIAPKQICQQPRTGTDSYDLALEDEKEAGIFAVDDGEGQGCPFGSHVRRMRARPDAQGHMLQRPLVRRSVPFGKPTWDEDPSPDDHTRGHIGHFFCASIENQFEHLLGRWGAQPPLGADMEDDALDPLMGPHDDPDAGFIVPLADRKAVRLKGLRACTRTLGMTYAWHPGRTGLAVLFKDDFEPDEVTGPWL